MCNAAHRRPNSVPVHCPRAAAAAAFDDPACDDVRVRWASAIADPIPTSRYSINALTLRRYLPAPVGGVRPH
jgi:hypothetical protein